MNTRLLGAAVLIALVVLFVPMFFSSKPSTGSGDQSVSLAIPPAPGSDLKTKTMSLVPGGASSAPSVPQTGTLQHPVIPMRDTTVTPGSNGNLARVNIGSSKPSSMPSPTSLPTPAPGVPVQQPAQRIAAPARPVQPQPVIPQQPAAPVSRSAPAPAAPLPAATDARGYYTLNLSAYYDSAAQRLIQRVRALGYPASGQAIQRAGKALTMVYAGPFDTRAAAEAARLRIRQAIPRAPAYLQSGASTPTGDAPAPAANAPSRAGGWAVQVAAMGTQADADALRDKLRADGFDGFVDSVVVGGRRLWRVRAGPRTQRGDALSLRDQIKAKLGLAGVVVSVP